ncbi:MAG: GTPase [Pirellulales bacterium]
MTLNLEDTIAAVATAAGGALRGAIRLSGPTAIEVVVRCLADGDVRPALERLRAATVVAASLKLDGDTLPCDLFVWPTERSYTRQIVVEVHTVGSPPLLDAALQALCAAGARLAAPGEFTLRAFLSGRLDLAQAEAVLGVIDAHDRRALDVALVQLAGGLSQPLGAIREALVDLLADLEAGLDFVDEDIEFVSAAQVEARLAAAAGEAANVAKQLGTRSHRSHAPRVVLAGLPNAGKSSLFNALCGGTAIVSDVAGTTRDALLARVDFDGIACELVDTAGVDEGRGAGFGVRGSGFGDKDAGEGVGAISVAESLLQSTIAAAAQSQTHARLADADVELWCIDATQSSLLSSEDTLNVATGPPSGRVRLLVATKVDALAVRKCESRIPNSDSHIHTSSQTGEGLDELRTAIAAAVAAATHAETAVVVSTAVRCRESLRLAVEAIEQARQLAIVRGGDELIAAELRLALAELGKIVGVVYTDDILDRLFGRFCIGK